MIKMILTSKSVICMSILLLCATFAQAQRVTLPRASQSACVSQRIGITDISIKYHSPAVNERKVWGALVPYGQVWRAGANENTLFEVSHDVKVEGQDLAAGAYGLYMIPSDQGVDVIFSSATKNWGTVAPTEDETVLTVNVIPQTINHQEWLSYDFANRGGNDVTAQLKWETRLIPFRIEADVNQIVVDNLKAELKGQAGFGYQGREQAARYCLLNDLDTAQALVWIDRSIGAEKRFSNLIVKSGLLKKMGDQKAADALLEEALTMASPVQMNIYGYQQLNGGDVPGAVKTFLKNIAKTPKTHPFYWGFVDSVGEAYLKSKDKTNALKYYRLAKDFAPDNRQAYLDGVISGILEMK